MQSYCIYAEAFAGPFWPLRAPEPPFTHKTPPFTQVLFLFDAFYGTISSRKPSSLCSYKTESEAPMKKRILALLLAFSMMLSLLPVSALADTGGGIDFAAYASNGSLPDLVMDNDTGKPNVSQIEPDSRGVYQGNGWMYNKTSDALMLNSGKYDFNYTVPRFDGSEHTLSDPHLNCVNVNHIVVQPIATIVGGVFEEKSLLNHGTVTNALFNGNQVENPGTLNCLFKSKPFGIGYHSLTAADNSTVEVLLYSSVDGNTTTTHRGGTIYFTGTPKLTVKLDHSTIHYINGEEHYGGKTSPDGKGYQTFTPKAGEDVVLNREPYATDLEMTPRGFPDTTGREPIYDSAKNVIGCKGKGWKYENGTLTLESGSYDFTYTKPSDATSTRHSNHVRCNVIVNKGAAITGGILNGNSLTNSGTVKDVLIMGGQITNNGKLSCLLDRSVDDGSGFTRRTMTAVDGSQIYYTVNQQSTGNGTQLYFTGTPKFTVKLEKSDIRCINGDKNYGGLRPSVVHGYYTFTPEQEEDIVLNREPYVTDLVMTPDGIPDITNVAGGKDGTHFSYKGDGWTFTGAADIPDAIGTLTLNKNTNSYDFRYLDPLNGPGGELAAVKCPLMNDGATIENGVFKNLVINHSGTISGGTFAVGLFSIDSEDFSTSGTVTGGAFNGKDGLSDGAHAVTVNGGSIRKVNDTEPLEAHEINDSYGLRYDIVPSAEWNLYSYEGTILTVTADTDITNINGWDIGKFPGGSSYPNGEDDKTTVSFRMPDGPVVLNDPLYTLDIIRGTMLGNTSVSAPAGTELILEADEPAKNETFLGWTLSDESLLTKGTLNDPNCTTITITMKNASATAEAVFQKDTPAYTLTVTGGGLVNGKTSAVVKADEEVRLTVGEGQDGMSFNYWDLPTALTTALTAKDSTFSNKVENLTFTMPDLSEYTEDTRFTIRLDIRPAELPDDDDGPSVLGTMATVAVGGAAAGILVWQGVSLGVDSYLQLSLPDGVPVPTNRRELVKLLWETAGKPDVVLPALYGDVSTEDAELQKATRWAIDNGLVKPADETDASRFDPDRSVSKYEVARAWFKVQQMLK